ncbi:hypothetical protein [Chitinophaga silvisoli]|uniref:hypothetical protein n=1 Tax=Chitinophaga silvisoli TaxID=2291814 RepID=UPI0011C0D301|nr:hypothetical protein [Chitinophaga silvisoli]
MNNLRNSSLKGIIWLLLVTVFTVGVCDYLYTYYKSYIIENASDEAPFGDFGDSCVKKGGKKLFSFYEDGLSFCIPTRTFPLSVHWGTYSFSIFKEPLRDVLTPPPLLFI